MKVFLRDIWRLLVTTVNKAIEDEIFTFSAAIAFYTIFSFAPILILLLYLGGIFLSEQTIIDQIQNVAGNFLDESVLNNMNQYLAQLNLGEGSLTTTILAIVAVVFGATTVVGELKIALNRIWNVKEVKMNSVWNFLFNRLLSFGMIIILGTLLILSLVAEAALGTIGTWLVNFLPDFGLDYYQLLIQIGTIIIATVAFTLIFSILPDIQARLKDVAVGGLVTTLLFLIGKFLISYYFTSTGITAAYKAAGSLIIFIIWVYYNILVVLIGAVFTQVYTERYGERILPYRFSSLKKIPNIENRD
ncbi:YihY/virulence factor BrkB family protein [Rhodohalobacter sulfatireducens]|uniref:YihY/virulence factor BrkB family protein n=1 Tax=Rhodohalobacter sulfatireducens TaxID=2911366 RepID=A0ABS9KH72_9BACT|nr:YihY/virulence factor BrkB family protein [Rhodohalobacter sulfatireducens]MCG2590198.1 YihY/virulence factor BrkB family protein [Rhodohalobacter sulfatireducens]MDR9407845.1 YihY/virulence factor BrkB family protein [Balneolaceae bacterium]